MVKFKNETNLQKNRPMGFIEFYKLSDSLMKQSGNINETLISNDFKKFNITPIEEHTAPANQ